MDKKKGTAIATDGKIFVSLKDENAFDLWFDNSRGPLTTGSLGGPLGKDGRSLANQFWMAATTLLEAALDGSQSPPVWMIPAPVLFLYRHAVELYLKAILPSPPRIHDLHQLLDLVDTKIIQEHGQSLDDTWGLDHRFANRPRWEPPLHRFQPD